MASRTWLAVLICFGIWFTYLQWFAPPPPLPKPGTQQPTTAVPKDSQSPSLVSGTAPSSPLFAKPIKAGEIHTVSGSKVDLSFSTNGGKIHEARLTKYRQTISKDSPPISPVSPEVSSYSLATLFSDSALEGFGSEPYAMEVFGNEVKFARESQGVRVEKTYTLDPDTYVVHATYRLNFSKPTRREWGYLVVPIGATEVSYDANQPLQSWETVVYQNDSVTRRTMDSLKEEGEIFQGTTNWYAFGNRYFSTVAINQSRLNPDVALQVSKEFRGGYMRYPLVLKDGENALEFKIDHYIGPRDYAELSKVKLIPLMDYGKLEVFAVPLLKLLRFFYSLIPNYGVAIILLTLLVRLVFYPLQAKSVKSMKAMQKLQPQIAALKEKYKDDMTKFNQEQMALFKAHKVNPMGGCLPILVQLPVLFALYSVIGNSIELFHAPFFGWIHDLSAKDPFYIYPILMGISMFVQQKMTPAAGMDPAQQKIMLFMPILFTFMMVGLPAGLTLYIFVSTVLGILQQVATRDKTGTPAKLAPAVAK
jgi:YidC/Oxa1 family membrane protein insertase